jgi:hypothetical protein
MSYSRAWLKSLDYMAELQDILMESVIKVLADRIDSKVLHKADSRHLRKKLFKHFTYEMFYQLLKEGEVAFAPGFGSMSLKEIKEKDKKIWNKKLQTIMIKHVKGRKIQYKAGDIVREFL